MSQQHIGRLLRDERPAEGVTQATALALADALEVRVEWLLRGTGAARDERACRLRERAEWPAVAAAVMAEHPELDADALALVGDVLDDPIALSGKLDQTLVYSLALALREWKRRAGRNA